MNSSEYLKGRGAQINPNNKFFSNQYVQEHVEGLDEEFLGAEKTQFIPTHPKSIISKSNSPDLPSAGELPAKPRAHNGCWGRSCGRQGLVRRENPMSE